MAKARILLVDDDHFIVEALADLLQFNDYEIITAHNGVEALSILAAQPPDLIVSDTRMPQMDGVELLKAAKGEPRTAAIPFIVLSALSEKEEVAEMLRLGAAACISKPYSPSHLLHEIARHL